MTYFSPQYADVKCIGVCCDLSAAVSGHVFAPQIFCKIRSRVAKVCVKCDMQTAQFCAFKLMRDLLSTGPAIFNCTPERFQHK